MNIKVAAFTVSEKSSNTNKCNKDGIVHYILRSHRSEFTYCDVFFKKTLKNALISAKSVVPDEIQHYAAFHLGLHCLKKTGPRSAVGNVSGYRCMSDCRSRGQEFDPGPVLYFRGD